jgi:cysteine-S-conjugate beta-lyase
MGGMNSEKRSNKKRNNGQAGNAAADGAQTVDYDTIPQRRGTGSIKWEMKPHPEAEDQIPLWVADMDFPAPRPLIDALHRRVEQGVFGYTWARENYYRAIDSWFSRRFGLSVKKEDVTICPGIVPAVNIAVKALTKPGDGVIIQNPVYYPFTSAVKQNGRKLLINNLTEEDGRWTIDFPNLEEAAKEAKMLILCSPHNPVGRVWSREELERVADIARRRELIVVSDEIHCDLVMPDAPQAHIPWNLLSEDAAHRSILCTAPSKSFNIPGLATSNIIISNPALRKVFRQELNRSSSDLPNVFGTVASEAAYLEGEAWLEETLVYIAGNRDAVLELLSAKLPGVTAAPLEATYLLWLDFRSVLQQIGTDSAGLERVLVDEAKVWLEAGSIFGERGEGFMRVNIATARPLLMDAFTRIVEVLKRSTL